MLRHNIFAFLFAALSSVWVSSSYAQGNGMPNGAHYNLNIIGVPKDKAADMTAGEGHRIFVKLSGNTKISLIPGTAFSVLDANGTDRNGARFSLPTDVATSYSVWARALGKPGGTADMTTCYTDIEGATYCLGGVVSLTRKSGKPVATDVSADLLNVVVCIAFDDAGNCIDTTAIPLFSDLSLDYLWSYDSSGLRLAQLRFYPIK